MKKLFTYVPIICLIMVILFIDSTWMKGILLVGISVLIVFAKFKRNKLQQEEIVTDDRVNANISKWSLRSMFGLNTLLIVILFVDNQGIFKLNFNMEMILVYLLITLCIPFYIVPAVLKHY